MVEIVPEKNSYFDRHYDMKYNAVLVLAHSQTQTNMADISFSFRHCNEHNRHSTYYQQKQTQKTTITQYYCKMQLLVQTKDQISTCSVK